tara:strand:- start:608 stop:3823 length:3216 start_codon:yes stop_codon:yes gene_type:complete
MATITQTIPSYLSGISQQPDTLKTPGQVSVAKNVLPDVTEGLMKRPGGRLVGSLSDGTKNSVTTGRWFSYYRDEDEQYIGQIDRVGEVRIWRCSDGAEQTVSYDSSFTTELKLYLNHYADDDLQVLTLNDVTYVTNRADYKSDGSTPHPKTDVAKKAATTATRNPEAYFELKKIAYANQYAVNIYDNDTETEIYTATRIKVQRTHDSSNACSSGGTLSGLPTGGYLCSDGSGAGGVNTDPNQDAYCPNVDTQIFTVSHGDSGDSADANGQSWTISVNASGGSLSDRKDLYFRIATIGQSVPQGGSATNPDYRCRYTTTHDLLHGGEGWRKDDWFYVYMKNARYKVTVEEHSVAKVRGNLAAARPSPTPFDNETTITTESILGALETEIIAGGTFTDSDIELIGNGLHVSRSSGVFNANSPAPDLINVLTDSVNVLEDLPNQCKHGYIVKIANSVEDEDDWYVQFKGHNDKDGAGVWEECRAPGLQYQLDPETLPIQIVRQADGSFKVSHCTYEDALVGDETTNPWPSFVGNKIRKMIFFRNRVCFMSDENIIMSKPGLKTFDFFNKTALTFSNVDPIDLSVGSDKPAIIYDAIQVNTGLILFTKTQQFMLTTDSDILSPNTAKINTLANYNFNSQTNPISLGVTIGWLDNAGKNSRFFEMQRTMREGEPDVVEQSKLVSKLFNKELRLISNSRENGVIFFSEVGTSTIYCYRYFNSEEKRIQAAWFTWEVPGAIQHHAVLDDSLYVIVRNNSKDQMLKFAIKLPDDTRTVTDDIHTAATTDDILYRLHLDHSKPVNVTTQIYDKATDKSTFAKPDGYEASDKTLVAYDVTLGDDYPDIGRYDVATIDGSNVVLDGNWSRRVTAVTITNAGSGYTSAPTVTFSGGGAPSAPFDGQAKATATISDGKITAITVTDNGFNYTSNPTITITGGGGSSGAATCTVDSDMVLGYNFDYEVKLPTIYRTSQQQQKFRSDIQASLIIQRLKLNLGNAGLYETLIERTGKPDYTETWEPAVADSYLANSVDFVESVTQTIPTYEKNTNLSVTIKSSHPAPATLYSMSWEGDYSTKFYQRV